MNIDLSREKLEIKKSQRETSKQSPIDINTLTSTRGMCIRKRSISMGHCLSLRCAWLFLHKGAFQDALCLRYGWESSGVHNTCCCSNTFSIDHAMSCHRGGFPTLRPGATGEAFQHYVQPQGRLPNTTSCHRGGFTTLRPAGATGEAFQHYVQPQGRLPSTTSCHRGGFPCNTTSCHMGGLIMKSGILLPNFSLKFNPIRVLSQCFNL